jgi:voltage-gated potassium channel
MTRLEGFLDWIVIAAATLVVPSVYLETQAHGGWQDAGVGLDWAIWIVFAIEFVILLSLAKNRWRWLREHPLEIVVVFLTPPFAPAAVQSLRVFRVLRLLRLMRLAPVARRALSIDGVKYIALLTGLPSSVAEKHSPTPRTPPPGTASGGPSRRPPPSATATSTRTPCSAG